MLDLWWAFGIIEAHLTWLRDLARGDSANGPNWLLFWSWTDGVVLQKASGGKEAGEATAVELH